MDRRAWLLLACLALCQPAAAQERTYAIMSLVGDQLLIVHQDISTGSRLDKNSRDYVELHTPALDNALVIAIEDAMRERDRSVKTVLLAARDPALFALQARGLEEGPLALLLPVVSPLAQKAGATHLVLASKHRDDSRIRMADGHVGAGRIEGLGFYVNDNMRVQNRNTGASTTGYIAPFGYFSLAVVDLATGAVVSQQLVREAYAISNQKAAVPWNALTAEQKVQMLQQLIRRETRRAVPLLLP
jgi:hypothetical protein